MQNRRQFFNAIGGIALGGVINRTLPLSALLGNFPAVSDDVAIAARDEEFWAEIARSFPIDRSFVNLNAGGVSPTGGKALEAFMEQYQYAQGLPSHRMWKEQLPQMDAIRQKLAESWGVSAEEVALTRNASEGLHICQNGIDLSSGDEVITTTLDYPRMINAWKQRELRDGIVLKQIQIPIPFEDTTQLVKLFREAISPRTKVIHVCHVINLNGQILPIREISDMAHRRGIKVIVDGAHSFAHFDFKISDLNCDYFATSLHKWLAAPTGNGLLWMRHEHIKNTWPLMAGSLGQMKDIRKFEEIGTNPIALKLGIPDALELHQKIGGERKFARLQYLRDRWVDGLNSIPGFRLHSSLNEKYGSSIATFELPQMDSVNFANHLYKEFNILVSPIGHSEINGIRVSPSVYTTHDEIDRFVEVVKEISS